jgi:hypothetical protein
MTTALDPKTLIRVATVICDIDGPSERHVYELEQLLRDAGWSNPPEYDGPSRVRWLTEALADRAKDHGDIARLLCRVCDPLEYDGGMPIAEAFRAELNRILEAERLAVSYVGGRPVLGELTDDPDQPMFSAPEGLENRLSALLTDPRMVMLLVDRAEQSRGAQASGAYLLALFGIGSFVEGLLLSVLMERYPELNSTGFRGRDGRKISANRAGLELLIDTAHDKRLIQFDAKSFMDPVRNFRNFIHPRQQLEHDFLPDEDTVALCWGPVHAVLNDLEEHHA